MKDRCPKCKRKYAKYGSNVRTEHHVIPRKLWNRRDLPEATRRTLEQFTVDICRLCHNDLTTLLDKIERDLLYTDHQGLYIKALTTFLGGNHALPALPVPPVGGRDGP